MAVLRVFVCLCGEPCRKGCTVNVRSGRLTCIAGSRNPERGKVLKREKCYILNFLGHIFRPSQTRMNKGLCPIVKCRQKQRAATGYFRSLPVAVKLAGHGFALRRLFFNFGQH